MLLPFRAAVLALLGILLLGLLGGSLGASLTIRRFLRVTPGGERVIERVEQVTVAAEDALASAAASISPNTAVVLDDQGRIHASAVALTQDGVLMSAGPIPKGTIRIRRADGETVPASVVRIYPEVGVFFLRASGTFSAPSIERELSLSPGSTLAATAPVPDGSGPRVRIVTVEASQALPRGVQARYRGLGLVSIITSPLPASLRGAPLVGTDGRMRGVVAIEGESTFAVSGGASDLLLQDFLRHQNETTVEVLRGLQGDWHVDPAAPDREFAFRVTEVAQGSAFASAGLRVRDEVVAVDGAPLRGPIPLFASLLGVAREQKSVALIVRRAAETVTLQVSPSAQGD